MERFSFVLLRSGHFGSLGFGAVRLRYLRNSSASTSVSKKVVNLHSNRYNQLVNEGTSLALPEASSWKDKLEFAAACYRAGNVKAFDAVVALARENSEKRTNAANRILYLAMDMALNQDRIDIAEELSKLLPQHVHVLATSLKIRLFVRQKRFWDALQEVEKVLNEDTAGLDVRTKVCKSVMDEFYTAISDCDDAIDEARKFFTLQRLLSKYSKRTSKTLAELLLSEMVIPPEKGAMEGIKIDEILLDKIVEHTPEVLTDDKIRHV